MKKLLLVFWLSSLAGFMAAQNEAADPAPTLDQARGIWQVKLPSPHQKEPTLVEIALPEPLEKGKTYPVVYVLPVVIAGDTRYGNGMVEALKDKTATKYQVICVSPSFVEIPWYGNHATDPQIRHEDFVIKTLVPYIEKHFPAEPKRDSRWLLGFSKSGWGAFTLILRHPDIFGFAASWDSPLLMNGDNTGKNWGPIGIDKVFGTKETFQQFLPSKLISEKADSFKNKDTPRIILAGSTDSWRTHVEGYHTLLDSLGISHVYRPDLVFPHRWDGGWYPALMEELARAAKKPL